MDIHSLVLIGRLSVVETLHVLRRVCGDVCVWISVLRAMLRVGVANHRRKLLSFIFFFQAEDGIRDLVRSRGLGDVYKRQAHSNIVSNVLASEKLCPVDSRHKALSFLPLCHSYERMLTYLCLLYTSDAADERSSVDLGGRRIIKKKKYRKIR